MLMWRREERRDMRVWLPYKHQAGHESIGISGAQVASVVRRNRRERLFEDK
jgi:hypothetical protein